MSKRRGWLVCVTTWLLGSLLLLSVTVPGQSAAAPEFARGSQAVSAALAVDVVTDSMQDAVREAANVLSALLAQFQSWLWVLDWDWTSVQSVFEQAARWLERLLQQVASGGGSTMTT